MRDAALVGDPDGTPTLVTRRVRVLDPLVDLDLAAHCSDHLVALERRRVVTARPPGEVVTEAVVEDVLGPRCRVVADPVCSTPLVVPVARHHGTATGTPTTGTPATGGQPCATPGAPR